MNYSPSTKVPSDLVIGRHRKRVSSISETRNQVVRTRAAVPGDTYIEDVGYLLLFLHRAAQLIEVGLTNRTEARRIVEIFKDVIRPSTEEDTPWS